MGRRKKQVEAPDQDLNESSPGVQAKTPKTHRAVFLLTQLYRGKHYDKGDTLDVEAWEADAYKGRVRQIRFELLPN